MYLDVVHIYIFVFFKLDEWLQSYDLKCTNMYNLDMWGVCTLANFLSFPTISNRFRPVWLKNHPQLQIWPKKWIRLVQNGQIWSFYTIFYHFPQNEAEIDSELSISPNSQLFPSFATKASHFWGNPKNVHFWLGGGVHQQMF